MSGDFAFLTKLIADRSGITVGEDKRYLIETRLPKVARKHNLSSIDEMIAKLKIANANSQLVNDVIEAMTTNESLFFRDTKPFEQLKKYILPEFKTRPLNIWSAAASTGQEAYSIAMTCEELGFKNYNITGTDISPSVIERAKEGKYSQFEVQRGLPITHLIKYFTQQGNEWQIKPAMKERVKFRNFNLLENYTPLGKFDVVFCRNVLIYFSKETKTQVLDKIAQVLNPGGFLYLGSSENLFDLTNKFASVPGEGAFFKLV